jgi:hypothetical protein
VIAALPKIKALNGSDLNQLRIEINYPEPRSNYGDSILYLLDRCLIRKPVATISVLSQLKCVGKRVQIGIVDTPPAFKL